MPDQIRESPLWDEMTIKEFWAFQQIKSEEIEQEVD